MSAGRPTQLELDVFGLCKFPEGKPPGKPGPGDQVYDDRPPIPCGQPQLYERFGCRGPECRQRHSEKVALQREKRRNRAR